MLDKGVPGMLHQRQFVRSWNAQALPGKVPIETSNIGNLGNSYGLEIGQGVLVVCI